MKVRGRIWDLWSRYRAHVVINWYFELLGSVTSHRSSRGSRSWRGGVDVGWRVVNSGSGCYGGSESKSEICNGRSERLVGKIAVYVTTCRTQTIYCCTKSRGSCDIGVMPHSKKYLGSTAERFCRRPISALRHGAFQPFGRVSQGQPLGRIAVETRREYTLTLFDLLSSFPSALPFLCTTLRAAVSD